MQFDGIGVPRNRIWSRLGNLAVGKQNHIRVKPSYISKSPLQKAWWEGDQSGSCQRHHCLEVGFCTTHSGVSSKHDFKDIKSTFCRSMDNRKVICVVGPWY